MVMQPPPTESLRSMTVQEMEEAVCRFNARVDEAAAASPPSKERVARPCGGKGRRGAPCESAASRST